jgi:hypothetical protein
LAPRHPAPTRTRPRQDHLGVPTRDRQHRDHPRRPRTTNTHVPATATLRPNPAKTRSRRRAAPQQERSQGPPAGPPLDRGSSVAYSIVNSAESVRAKQSSATAPVDGCCWAMAMAPCRFLGLCFQFALEGLFTGPALLGES